MTLWRGCQQCYFWLGNRSFPSRELGAIFGFDGSKYPRKCGIVSYGYRQYIVSTMTSYMTRKIKICNTYQHQHGERRFLEIFIWQYVHYIAGVDTLCLFSFEGGVESSMRCLKRTSCTFIIPQRFKGPSFAIVTAQLVGLVFDIDRTVSKSRWQNGCLMSLMSWNAEYDGYFLVIEGSTSAVFRPVTPLATVYIR